MLAVRNEPPKHRAAQDNLESVQRALSPAVANPNPPLKADDLIMSKMRIKSLSTKANQQNYREGGGKGRLVCGQFGGLVVGVCRQRRVEGGREGARPGQLLCRQGR